MMSHHIVKQMSKDIIIIIIIIIICDDDEMLEMDSRMRWGRRRTGKKWRGATGRLNNKL